MWAHYSALRLGPGPWFGERSLGSAQVETDRREQHVLLQLVQRAEPRLQSRRDGLVVQIGDLRGGQLQ
jgi:hypothetical protein